MPTTITNTIGASGADYTTMALWEDGTDNTSLVTADEVRVGALMNEEFTAASSFGTIGGATTDATRYRELKCAAGASFRDNASVQTNALRYNASNGAGLRMTAGFDTVLNTAENNVHLNGLQISSIADGASLALYVQSGTGIVVENCILEGKNTNGAVLFNATGVIRNCLITQHVSGANLISQIEFATADVVNCTFAVPSDLTAATDAVAAGSGTVAFKNCAFFGATDTTGSGTPTYTTCYGDDASPPTGVTTATYANQFQNTAAATRDFRLKTGADCIDNGTTDTTNGPIDIAGTARPSGSAYDVGAWEFVAAGGGIVIPVLTRQYRARWT